LSGTSGFACRTSRSSQVLAQLSYQKLHIIPSARYENSKYDIWNPYLCHNINIKWGKNSDQTNKQERHRNLPHKQDHVLLITVNKDKWPIRREYLSHVTIIMQMDVYQPR